MFRSLYVKNWLESDIQHSRGLMRDQKKSRSDEVFEWVDHSMSIYSDSTGSGVRISILFYFFLEYFLLIQKKQQKRYSHQQSNMSHSFIAV